MDSKVIWAVVIGVAALGPACSGGGPAESGTQPTPAPASQPVALAAAPPAESAQEIFKNRCSPCHGPQGRGDGPASAALTPKPRDYADAEWQKSVTDDQIKKTILYGGAAVGKSPVMPSQPDLESKPEALAGLVQLIREVGKAP
jgi:mono/diheme cytochrome c family protein